VRSLVARLNKPGLIRQHDDLDPVAELQLQEDLSDVRLDRPGTHDEVIGDLGPLHRTRWKIESQASAGAAELREARCSRAPRRQRTPLP
jgi:hypothetical protein